MSAYSKVSLAARVAALLVTSADRGHHQVKPGPVAGLEARRVRQQALERRDGAVGAIELEQQLRPPQQSVVVKAGANGVHHKVVQHRQRFLGPPELG